MKKPWFKRTGIFSLPSSIPGWIIFLAGLAYAVYAFIHIDSRSHSASDTLRNWVFQLMITWAVYSLIALATSKNTRNQMKGPV